MDGETISWDPGTGTRRQQMEGTGAQLVKTAPKLQALVYDILLSATAVFSYAIGSIGGKFRRAMLRMWAAP